MSATLFRFELEIVRWFSAEVVVLLCSVVREATVQTNHFPSVSLFSLPSPRLSQESLYWSYGRLQCRQDNTRCSLFKGNSAHAKPVGTAFSLHFTDLVLSGFPHFQRISEFMKKNIHKNTILTFKSIKHNPVLILSFKFPPFAGLFTQFAGTLKLLSLQPVKQRLFTWCPTCRNKKLLEQSRLGFQSALGLWLTVIITSPTAATPHHILLSDEICQTAGIYLAYKSLPPDSVVAPVSRSEYIMIGSWNDTVNIQRISSGQCQ